MTKGVNKNIICIKDTGSKYFEEAIFIVSPGVSVQATEGEMAEEAKKIVDRYIKKFSGQPRKKKGIGTAAIVSMLLALSSVIAVCFIALRML